jgi:hypothetical protein
LVTAINKVIHSLAYAPNMTMQPIQKQTPLLRSF